jgi:hypothetical protein
MNYTLTLTEQQINVILQLLGEAPLKMSLPIYNVIQQQLAEQTRIRPFQPPTNGRDAELDKTTS